MKFVMMEGHLDNNAVYVTSLLHQHDIHVLQHSDCGASSTIYEVNNEIVLKVPLLLEPPEPNAGALDHNCFQQKSKLSHGDLENERQVFQTLAPHPNIVEAISLDHSEGIYLRKYTPLSQRLAKGPAELPLRLAWYLDIARALHHLHKARKAHCDLRVQNCLCDSDDNVRICDLGLCCSFGTFMPTDDDEFNGNLNVNGHSEFVSDVTDRFSLASLIFHMETGTHVKLEHLTDSGMDIPRLKTGMEPLDTILQRAWCEEYKSTEDMLNDITIAQVRLRPSPVNSSDVATLRQEVARWRNERIDSYGMCLSRVMSSNCSRERLERSKRVDLNEADSVGASGIFAAMN